jgi:hypothetical protein
VNQPVVNPGLQFIEEPANNCYRITESRTKYEERIQKSRYERHGEMRGSAVQLNPASLIIAVVYELTATNC